MNEKPAAAHEDLVTVYREFIEAIEDHENLCHLCLVKNVAFQLDQLQASLHPDDLLEKASQFRFKGRAIEGIDYYREGDRLVSTSWKHIKRGRCCSSDCRHCPYPLI